MRWWEILLIIQGYRRRNVLQYQIQRIQAFASAFCMGNKDHKTPEDLFHLYCDDYINHTEQEVKLTEDEIKQMQDEMAAYNAQLKEGNQ